MLSNLVKSGKVAGRTLCKHKKVLLSLLLLQLLFIGCLGVLSYHFSTLVQDHMDQTQQKITSSVHIADQLNAYLIGGNTIENSAEQLQQLPLEELSENALLLEQFNEELVSKSLFLLLLGVLAYIFFSGLSWLLSFKLVYKKSKHPYMLHFLMVVCCYVFFFGLFTFQLLEQTSLFSQDQTTGFGGPILLLIVLYYFYCITLSLLGKIPLGKLFKETLKRGVSRIHVYGLALLLFFCLLGLFGYLLVSLLTLSLWLSLLFFMMAMATIVYSRVFFLVLSK